MSDNRTERPTPKRRDEARKKGQIAKSADVNTAVAVLAGLGTLTALGGSLLMGYVEVMRRGLSQTANPSLASGAGLGSLAEWGMLCVLKLAGPIAGAVLVAGICASVLQVRPKITPQALKPQFGRISPKSGIKRLISVSALFEAGKAIAKTSVIGGAAFLAVWGRLGSLAAMTGMPPAAILFTIAGMVSQVALYVGVAFIGIAGADYAWQRHRHEKSLKMTKDEVKQEAKQQDIAPEVRRAIRRRQFQQARKRMIAEVATPDVVITNPTHFAVALRYDGTRPAPELIAKGADLVAAAIREEAEKHDVTVVTNPPLARALYREVELGQMIPDGFFQAVAEVLAFVYRTAGRKAADRRRRIREERQAAERARTRAAAA